ncbi:hypothetical protein kw2_0890 [Lactococcus cremoris subsp. cremoris KW2]|nr:hypothetical protein kw2_0890 [Lactococcus cremoris subsp. cremoris KW2]
MIISCLLDGTISPVSDSVREIQRRLNVNKL